MKATAQQALRFLVVDGYDRQSRDDLRAAGMGLAADLYVAMLRREAPEAQCDLLFPSDAGAQAPAGAAVADYAGVLWTGCNATIYDPQPRIHAQLALARQAYAVGTPQFGSCWGLQIAVVAAGGEVAANPRGREMGLARRILLTEAGRNHPMMRGRGPVFEAFTSHADEVTTLPPNSVALAGNAHSPIQAAAVQSGKGVFWGVQFHPEYDLHEMARLIVAREQRLIGLGFYRDAAALQSHVALLEQLHAEPRRTDLRWLLSIDDDVLDTRVRTTELRNWLHHIVLPHAAAR